MDTVDSRATTLLAGSLHTHQIDALAVTGDKVPRRNFLAIDSFPILSRLLETDPNY
ncbi:MAG: hypothetical protein JRN20_06530 [Nitrososphaerota archaeon]|nr:hypothetical protein [Nitrososphaerota archaeon]